MNNRVSNLTSVSRLVSPIVGKVLHKLDGFHLLDAQQEVFYGMVQVLHSIFHVYLGIHNHVGEEGLCGNNI